MMQYDPKLYYCNFVVLVNLVLVTVRENSAIH